MDKMSLQKLPRFPSKKNSLEQERENFEKTQATCLTKAINPQETAVKEKHVRMAIIGTFHQKGATTFWDCVLRLPLKENDIVCWKFCHVLHKVLREGHVNVLKDSQRYKPMLNEHARFWGLLNHGYGKLIKIYCALLYVKLTFHQRNALIPGNLTFDLTDRIADNEDALFQLCVEMLDYLDGILELQSEIFKTMDASRCNSMTHSGQCRLKPLISCIQDSMLLYDYTTRILFQLHAKLTADLLAGHRERFNKVFHGLQQFYEKTMSLQYFKNLIEIQQLPKNPPNFLMQSDLENYETRKVRVIDSDTTDAQSDAHSDSFSDLVELQDTNGSNSPDPGVMFLIQERERRIKDLEDEIDRLKMELDRLRKEANRRIHELQFEIEELRTQLTEKTKQLDEKERVIEELKKHECKISSDTEARLDAAEKNAKASEEKYNKWKGLYTNLRQEHIDILRKKGAVDKELSDVKRIIEGQNEISVVLEALREEKMELETQLMDQIEKKSDENADLSKVVEQLKAQLEAVESTKKQMEDQLKLELSSKSNEITSALDAKTALQNSNADLSSELEKLNVQFNDLSQELSQITLANKQYQSQIEELERRMNDNQKNMENDALQRYSELLNVCVAQSEAIIKKAIDDLENPLLTGGSGALDNFILSCRSTEFLISDMKRATDKGYDTYPSLRSIVEQIPSFSHHIANLMLHGSATSRTSADIFKGDEMQNDCRNLGVSVLDLLEVIKSRLSGSKNDQAYQNIQSKLHKLLEIASNLGSSLTPEADAQDVLEKELHDMEAAIEAASKKMEEILSHSRASHTGVKLEVNEKLIDSCTALMHAIRLLVQRAKSLQAEIVAQGKGSASIKEFYKRNHQWTEGLISAAKAVGGGAKFLLESADKAVSNPGAGFEFLIASSQDIAASTVQLVVASQVRAERSSANLSLLKQASTGVKSATAHVVATAKDCAQLIEESDELDLSKLSTHNAKRLELETQAEVLRLVTELEKARMKLASLRQHHYHNSDG